LKKYVNAREVLPESLIKEIQKYVKGQHLYIPQTKRKSWGASTGIREELKQRNKKIYKLYNGGITTSELSDIFGLSEERIRNIIFDMNSN
jgi:Mor family transcriptional regulator